MIVSRVVRPAPKLATLTWWGDTTLGADLGVADASTDEVYAAMDWLLSRQDSIEAKLARRHLTNQTTNPHRMALFDLSSSWMEGQHCPLAAWGYSRDGKKGKPQIEYGLLTDPHGRPVAVRVFAGNTGDPTAFVEAVTVVRDTFGLRNIIMAGDRGMITNARIDKLKQPPSRTASRG
jgi:transposase